MPLEDFMAKVRAWDINCQRWLMRGAFFIFFEFVLAFVFFILLFNLVKFFDIAAHSSSDNLIEQLLIQQTANSLIIIGLLIINSFWMLYMFSGINRLRLILKDISYNLMVRRKQPNKSGFDNS